MKTTIELPDDLLHRAKVLAAQRRSTLKQLVIEGLEKVMSGPNSKPLSLSPTEAELFEIDSEGIPVLKHRGVSVCQAVIDRIRDEEGI
jgi:hypothetical protein